VNNAIRQLRDSQQGVSSSSNKSHLRKFHFRRAMNLKVFPSDSWYLDDCSTARFVQRIVTKG
jgi:hypothetical protein